jgi:Flp pilus assembly protein TadG
VRRSCRSDDGSALVEFTYLSVLLMVPLVYVLVSVFLVQRAAFGTTEAARQAARAFARADDVATGEARAQAAARLALADQGVTLSTPVQIRCLGGDCLAPGSRVVVTVRYAVQLPLLGAVFGHGSHGAVPVTATHTEYVDRFRAR